MNPIHAFIKVAREYDLLQPGFEDARPHAFLCVGQRGVTLEINHRLMSGELETCQYPIPPMTARQTAFGAGIDKLGTIFSTRAKNWVVQQHESFWDTYDEIAKRMSARSKVSEFDRIRRLSKAQKQRLLKQADTIHRELKQQNNNLVPASVKDGGDLLVALKIDGQRNAFFTSKNKSFVKAWPSLYVALFRQYSIADKQGKVFKSVCSFDGSESIFPQRQRRLFGMGKKTPSLTTRNKSCDHRYDLRFSEASRLGEQASEDYVAGFRAIYHNRITLEGRDQPLQTRFTLLRGKDSQLVAMIFSESMGVEIDDARVPLEHLDPNQLDWGSDGGDSDTQESDASVESIGKNIQRPMRGGRVEPLVFQSAGVASDSEAYFMILLAEQGRISAIESDSLTAKEIQANVAQWFDDILVPRFSWDSVANRRTVTWQNLAKSLKVRFLAASIGAAKNCDTIAQLVRSVYLTRPISDPIYYAALREYGQACVRNDRLYQNRGKTGLASLALIFAYKRRKQMPAENNVAYLLGKAYAMYHLIHAKWSWMKHRNNGFDTRYFHLARTSTALAFARMEEECRKYLDLGLQKWSLMRQFVMPELRKIMTAVAKSGGLPRHLNPSQQGDFVMGRITQEAENCEEEGKRPIKKDQQTKPTSD